MRTRTRSKRARVQRVVILGSGPNRIGQGIEFDYCCVHASMALQAAGYETVMVNCNPETVSTDYDTSDRLYFEPVTAEDVANVLDAEIAAGSGPGGAPIAGVIVSLGGQTPLKLAHSLPPELVLGTSPASIDLAEDRERWNLLCEGLHIPQPPGGIALSVQEALVVAQKVGYPVLVRPSYVLGGRAMEIVYDDERLTRVVEELAGSLAREGAATAERPVLVDRFLEDAIEVDVDAVRDRTGEVVIAGVMEHVEEAGVHSGDSACALPPQTLSDDVRETLDAHTRAIAEALEVIGPINVQYAVKEGSVYVIEANPRASRTVPFVAKATGVPMAMVAARVMTGATLDRTARRGPAPPSHRRSLGERQRGGAALRPLPRRRHPARPRDAVDGRGDGDRVHVRAGLRQEPDRGGNPPAVGGRRVPLSGRPGQSRGPRGGPDVSRARLRAARHVGDGRLPRVQRPAGGDGGGQGGRDRGVRCRGAHRLGPGAARGRTRHAAVARAPTGCTSVLRPSPTRCPV